MGLRGARSFTDDQEVAARPDALLRKREEQADGVADAMEDDDGEVPGGGIGRVDVHEGIWPETSDARGVERPLKVAVCGAPEDEVADAEPREAEAVKGDFDGEEDEVDAVHVDVDEVVVEVRGEE